MLLSAGWDSNLLLWDIRQEKAVKAFYGPNLSGDAIDFHNNTILTGAYKT